MSNIKYSSTTKKPYTIIKNKKYFGFHIHKLPNRFASVKSEEPIQDWFNYKGFTFINQEHFVDMYGNVTIE